MNIKFDNWWLKFGCFLTGYNYNILSGCSEVAAKSVKRYTSALLIITLLWFFIGFTFSERYLKTGLFGSIVSAIIASIIIIQVERQIILSIQKNPFLYWFRGGIALMMALLGSVIIDQIIFKEDVEQKKILLLDSKVQKVYPSKANELEKQLRELVTTLTTKETERSALSEDIARNPTIRVSTETNQETPVTASIRDTATGNTYNRTRVVRTRNVSTNSIMNPKMEMLKSLDIQLSYLRKQKAMKDSLLLTLRPRVEQEINSKVGFLDELEVMKTILFQSNVALTIWLIWLFFLLCIELFILVSKLKDEQNDYDILVLHQMNSHKKKIELLNRKNEGLTNFIK